jgi:hypothetical protein
MGTDTPEEVGGVPSKGRRDLFDLQGAESNLLPRFIRAEANLLRLPLFALHTKGLRTLDGIQCRGETTRNDVRHEFSLITSRSTRTLYPGPLARRAHLAFLSLATERGFPLDNPINWSWYGLCDRMGITDSGRDIRQLKAAIKSTAALFIESHYALWSKPEKRLIHSREEGLRLYERYIFTGNELPDGSVADTNYLWLSDWYIDNLNHMFTAPLDYELWRRLEDGSSIASRLYEFLLINFYSGTPILRINYEKLVQFLPVKAERYRSDAKRQLEHAFALLTRLQILEKVVWTDSKAGLAQLHLYRGTNLTSHKDRSQLPLAFMDEDFDGSLEVSEIRTLNPPEWGIVTDFYRLWQGTSDAQPTKPELAQAKEIIDRYGQAKAKDLIRRLVKKLKERWPEAKAFGAIQRYLPEVSDEFDAAERRKHREQEEDLKRRREDERREAEDAEREKFRAAWQPVWDRLSDEKKDSIRRSLAEKFRMKLPPTLEADLCLARLAQEEGAPIPADLVV